MSYSRRSCPEYEDAVSELEYVSVFEDYSLGIEMMLGIDIQKWWHLDVMGNIYDYRVEGELLGQDFSESSFRFLLSLE